MARSPVDSIAPSLLRTICPYFDCRWHRMLATSFFDTSRNELANDVGVSLHKGDGN